MKTLIFFVMMSISLFASAQGFSSGNNFTILPIYGTLSVNCAVEGSSTPRTVQWICQDERLSPAEYDFFVGPEVDADTVELNAVSAKTHALTHKVAKYADGQSSVRFNLWRASVVQKPLLTEGGNLVSYVLKSGANVLQTGQYQVQVVRGKTLNCPSGTINSMVPEDCNNPMTLCDQYFEENNYCQFESPVN